MTALPVAHEGKQHLADTLPAELGHDAIPSAVDEGCPQGKLIARELVVADLRQPHPVRKKADFHMVDDIAIFKLEAA